MSVRNAAKQDYEVIIIGAGIGGLTAGAYLAKNGLKVLIVERSNKVGGYCGSFNRDGFVFDEAVHYINNYGPTGFLRAICRELDVESLVEVLTIDPSDRLIMPGARITIYHDVERTVEELSQAFPHEAPSIREFFALVASFNFAALYVKYKGKTFKELLDQHFQNQRLKTALGLFATTMGLTADKLSALSALAYYKGSILDGGYHPVGGAQSFANAFSQRFLQSGGELLLSSTVKRIIVNGNRVAGIELEDKSALTAKCVIANCDATQTFTKLVGEEHLDPTFLGRLRTLTPSASTLVVYLGIEKSLKGKVPDCCNLWHYPHEEMQAMSIDIVKDDRPDGFVHIGLSSLHDNTMAPEGCESLVLFCGASYQTAEYWRENKERLGNILIERAIRAIPDLRGAIRIKLPGSPHTLFRYTLNRNGAYRGWEPTIQQTRGNIVSQKTSVNGLYMAGHWVTTPIGNGGVSMVAQSGRSAARGAVRFLRSRSTPSV